MHARFTNSMLFLVLGISFLLVYGVVHSVQGEVESRETSVLAALRQPEVRILQVGEFFCEITAEPNEVWLGLYPTRSGYTLMPTTVRVDAFYDPAIGDDEDVTGATRVSVLGQNAPLFLITGMDTLKAGMVKTLFAGRLPLSMGSSLEFNLDEESSYSITAFRGTDSDAGGVNLGVELVKDSRSQVICTYDKSDAVVTYLLWAGDLDRDGKLDMLIDTVCDYNASGPMLFLSSLAEDGVLLKIVAQFETSPALVLN